MRKMSDEIPKWTDPRFLGSDIYDNVKAMLQRYQSQIQENPALEGKLIDDAIPVYIEKMQDAYISAGVTLPIMLDAIKEVANLFISENITFDPLTAKQKAVETYPDPRQQVSKMPVMTAEESKLLNELSVNQIWDIARNIETENTPEGQAARGLIQKEIVANKLNMKKKANIYSDEVNRIVAQWQETARAAGFIEVLNLFENRTDAYNTIMADLRGKYPEDIAHPIALQVLEIVPQLIQAGNKLVFKKEANDNPKYENGSLQTSDIPEKMITSIKNMQKNISKDKLYSKEDESDWVENGIQQLYHITILFGVNDDVAEDVEKIFKQYSAIKIETDGIDYFDNDDYSVAIVKCKSDALTKFHDELKDKFKNKDTYPKYKPHIAIAYLNKGERLEDADIEDMEWEINALELSTSDGKLEKVAALAMPIRESLDYPHSWNKKKDKKKNKKKELPEKEKKILQMDSNKLNFKKNSTTSLTEKDQNLYNELIDNSDMQVPDKYGDIEILGTALSEIEENPDAPSIDDIAPIMKNIHQQVPLEVGDISASIDKEIAPLIEMLWQKGFQTELSCQGEGDDNCWIEFKSRDDLHRFNNFVGRSVPLIINDDTVQSIFSAGFESSDMEKIQQILSGLGTQVSLNMKRIAGPHLTEKGQNLYKESSRKTFTNILDEPRASLDEAIWDIGKDDLPMLKPDVKIHIIENFLSYIARFGGYNKSEQWVKNMFYTGSTATYTYNDASDVDIHVIVDWDDLMAFNSDKARKDKKEMWQELHDVFWWTLNKLKLPGTKHPLTYYVVPPGDEKKLVDQKEEIYDIGHDVWLIPPGEAVTLPQEAMTIATEEAAEIMSRIEEHIANARKSIIDYDMLKILEKLNGNNTPVILQKFDDALKAIDKELITLKNEYALLKQKRQEGFDLGKPIVPSESKNYTRGNIIYKLVEKYKLMDVLREIKRITDAKPTEHDQIDDVSDALGFKDE